MHSRTTTTGRVRRALALIVAASTAIAIGVSEAPAAHAATVVTIVGVQPNGLVGVPQSITVTAAVDGVPCGSTQLAPPVSILSSTTGSTQTLGFATFANCVGSTFQYTYQWIPGAVTITYISAEVQSTQSNAVRSAIAAVSTTTRVAGPNVAQLGQPVTLTASVTANSGSQASPQGTIQFSILGGGNIGGPVQVNNAVPSTVQIQWIPAILGAQSIVATYAPAGGSSGNFTCGASCSSAPDVVQVTSTGVTVFLANPPSFSVGSPATLTAVVSVVPPSGTVTFTINGAILATNVPVQANGQAQAVWTPPAPGNFTTAIRWAGNGGQSGSAQEVVSVGTGPAQADVINLGPQGQGAWSPVGVYSLRNGTTTTFVSTTASGAPVTLSVAGPCTVNGNQMTVNDGQGQCRLTATSPGGNGYGRATAIYTVSLALGQQAPVAAIRASGRINRGATITLATRANNRTNAGQRIRWSITAGANNCQLRFPSNGNVQLRAVRNGRCDVRAAAPAIAGQWTRMQVNRQYTIR